MMMNGSHDCVRKEDHAKAEHREREQAGDQMLARVHDRQRPETTAKLVLGGQFAERDHRTGERIAPTNVRREQLDAIAVRQKPGAVFSGSTRPNAAGFRHHRVRNTHSGKTVCQRVHRPRPAPASWSISDALGERTRQTAPPTNSANQQQAKPRPRFEPSPLVCVTISAMVVEDRNRHPACRRVLPMRAVFAIGQPLSA
ncbi:hypothetical protein ACFFYR_05630 [Paraburkholderia dipogonis]|uniref:hypothetical protein n=1 Tax=Paraburkholderia dipogonis TaxID=1211383 RepID=UPI0035E78C27